MTWPDIQMRGQGVMTLFDKRLSTKMWYKEIITDSETGDKILAIFGKQTWLPVGSEET
jgi:hypothetical protein